MNLDTSAINVRNKHAIAEAKRPGCFSKKLILVKIQ